MLVVRGASETHDMGPADGRVLGDRIRGRDAVRNVGFFCPEAWGAGVQCRRNAPLAHRGRLVAVDLDRRQGLEELLIGQQEHGAAEALGEVKGRPGQAVALVDGAGRKRDDRIAARVAPAGELHVALCRRSRAARRRAHPLHVHNDERNFTHDRQADSLAVERDAGTRGRGKGARPVIAAATHMLIGSNFIFALDGDPADLGQLTNHVEQDRGSG